MECLQTMMKYKVAINREKMLSVKKDLHLCFANRSSLQEGSTLLRPLVGEICDCSWCSFPSWVPWLITR